MSARLGVFVLALAAAIAGACTERNGPRVTAVDLIKLAPRAERRPAGGDFPVVEYTCGGTTIAGQAVPIPSRVIFTMHFPTEAHLITAAAVDGAVDAAAEFRIGVSDRRTYETLFASRVAAGACRDGWTDITVDLSLYAGRQWSLFYRPDERTWELIFGVAVPEGAATRAIWGMPRIESDSRSAKAWRERRTP